MSENIDENLEDNMLESYLENESKKRLVNIIVAIQKGENLWAKIKPLYNHKNGKRTFTRKLYIKVSKYAENGFDVYCTTPIFAKYILKDSEIIEVINKITKRETINLIWDDYHSLDKVELGIKYFPNKKFYELTQKDIRTIVTKQNSIS